MKDKKESFPNGLPNDDQSFIGFPPNGNDADELGLIMQRFLNLFRLDGPDFKDTPKRVAKMWTEFLLMPEPKLTTFPLQGKAGMVVLNNHVAWGFCPHHLLPVRYVFKIGYIPQENVLGLSKLARIADYGLRRLPLQEDINKIIVNKIYETINPRGAGCVVVGEHLCMKVRGVKSQDSVCTTSFLKGCFLTEPAGRQEFMSL